MPENAAIGAPEGARVPQGTSHKDFALFGAPSPLISRTRMRVAARSPHVLFERCNTLPALPSGRARDPDEIAVRGKRLCRVERELPLTLPATQLANAPLKSVARKIAAGSPLPAG